MTPPDDDVRRWARTVLGMSAGDDAAIPRLLRQVAIDAFRSPPPISGAAFRRSALEADALDLQRRRSPRFPRSRPATAHDPRAAGARHMSSAQFADRFFEKPPVQRAATLFPALITACRDDPALDDRVARLGRGLEIDLARPGLAADEERVVSIVRELFPLAPDERALRRRQAACQAKQGSRASTSRHSDRLADELAGDPHGHRFRAVADSLRNAAWSRRWRNRPAAIPAPSAETVIGDGADHHFGSARDRRSRRNRYQSAAGFSRNRTSSRKWRAYVGF